MHNDINLEDVQEFALLGVNIEVRFGPIDTRGVRDMVNIFDVSSIGESWR